MFEKLLAIRYIKTQKRHSIFTISCISVAVALITLLFIGFSTYKHIIREAAYVDKPYHFKIMQLTEDEFSQLAGNADFTSCNRVDEPNGTISAEIMLGTYQDDLGTYINTLFPEKYLYSDRFEEYKTDLIDVNTKLVECDRLDLNGKYDAVSDLAAYCLFILLLAISLRLMIDTAFEVSSKERERQFGMLRCMGATTSQIVRIISFEGLFLCVIGIPAGLLLGTGISFAAFEAIRGSGIAEAFFNTENVPQIMHMHIDPLLILLGVGASVLWVFLSAYQTGMRIIKMTPIQAISGRSQKIIKVRRFSLFGSLFGWKGKLAARNNSRQPKRFIITVISLTLSITLFSAFSIVLGKSLEFMEKTVNILGLNYDIGVALKIDNNDQLSYKKGLDTLRESGYFDIDDFSKTQVAYFSDSEGGLHYLKIIYCPSETFDKQFEGELPITYDELTKQNAYLMLDQIEEDGSETTLYDSPEPFSLAVEQKELVTDEQYQAMTDTEKQNVIEYITDDYETGEKVLQYRYIPTYNTATLNIAGTAPIRKLDEETKKALGETDTSTVITLVGTLDMFENGAYKMAEKGSIVNTEQLEYVHLNLKNKNDHEKAKTYIGMNSEIMELDTDYYGDMQKMRTGVGALKIGMAFLSIMIGIIALVNMINILSTGILNRRSELAAMQCLGMTGDQLNGMTVIECLQYALTAGVLATGLIEALMYAMVLLLKHLDLYDVFGEMIDFAEPLPKVWISAVAAFAAAVLASFIPLGRMKKENLTDQLRTVE